MSKVKILGKTKTVDAKEVKSIGGHIVSRGRNGKPHMLSRFGVELDTNSIPTVEKTIKLMERDLANLKKAVAHMKKMTPLEDGH